MFSFSFLVILFIIILLLLAFIPVQVHVNYQKIDDEGKLKLKIKYLFISFNKVLEAPLPKTLNLMAQKKYTAKNIEKAVKTERIPKRNWSLIYRRIRTFIPRFVEIIANGMKLASKVFKPVKCKKLNIYNVIGLPDPSQTGMAIGGLYAIYSFLLSYLSHWIFLKPDLPQIKIIPQFNQQKILLKYDCIISFPLGHIIIVVFQAIRFFYVSHHLFLGIKENL